MRRPPFARVFITWMDEYGDYQSATFDQDDLESAEDLIGLMDGNICEGDLEP